MSQPTEPTTPMPFRDPLRHELSEIRANWVAFLILGILTILLGTFLIIVPWIGTIAAVWVLGALLIVGGVTQFVGAFWARQWSGFFLSLLAGVLYLVVGFLVFFYTEESVAGLTLLLAAFLIVGGIFRIIAALTMKLAGWGWVLAGGILALLLGILIWAEWPEASLWVIGLFVGIEMLFTGWSWVVIALTVRNLPKSELPPGQPVA